MIGEEAQWVISIFGVFVLGTLIGIIKYFFAKAKCFEILKKDVEIASLQIKDLKKEQERDRQTHRDMYQRLTNIDQKIERVLGKLSQ